MDDGQYGESDHGPSINIPCQEASNEYITVGVAINGYLGGNIYVLVQMSTKWRQGTAIDWSISGVGVPIDANRITTPDLA